MKNKKVVKILKKRSPKNKPTRKISAKNSKTKTDKISVKKSTFKPVPKDPAHSLGHKKLGKNNKISESQRHKIHLPVATDKVSNSEIIRKHNSRHRRIITGAAIGKTGRIVIK